jgi:hypothetical protein
MASACDVQTTMPDIAYQEGGNPDGAPVILLHGHHRAVTCSLTSR